MQSLVSHWLGFWGWEARAITVSRMQDKIVETPDGAFHVVLNAGRFSGLTLFTSVDNGGTWDRSFQFENSDLFSTAHLDLLEDGRTLTVSYQGANREVFYQTLSYDAHLANWSALTAPVTVFEAGQSARVSLPNHVMGVDGLLYTLAVGDAFFVPEINIAMSADEGMTWETSDIQLFGNLVVSVRGISTPDVTGAIVATDNSLAWYDATDPDAPLVEISENGSFAVLASHYSLTVVEDDIYLANITTEDLPQVELFVFEGATRAWRELEVQNTFAAEAYVQISSNPQGHLYLTFDDFGDSTLRVLESLDGGLTWEIEAEIEVEDRVFPALTRMAAPEYFTEDLVVFQMVQPREGSDFYGVSAVTVDVDADGSVLLEGLRPAREPVRDHMSTSPHPWVPREHLDGVGSLFERIVAEDTLL